MTTRTDIIGQNGNSALHYVWQDLEAIGVKPSIELCERVLELRGASWREHFKSHSSDQLKRP